MASYHDLLDAIARIRSVVGDPDAWKKGLTGEDVATACNPASPPAAMGAVLAKLTAAHPEVFLAGSPVGSAAPPSGIGEGAAADAIRDAEAALARQNTTAAHIDLQVVTAVLNAHSTHGDGVAELVALQRDIEEAVVARTDLDSPAGAREFQRFLIGKLRDIHNVLENSSLDATSRASLAAALATLYATSAPGTPERVPVEGPSPDTATRPPGSGSGRAAAVERSSSTTESVGIPGIGKDGSRVSDSGGPLPSELSWPELPPGSDLLWFDPAPAARPAQSLPTPLPASPAAPIPAPVMPPTATPPWGAGIPGGLPGGAPFGGGLPTLGGPTAGPSPLPELPNPDLRGHIRDVPAVAETLSGPEPEQDGPATTADSDDEASAGASTPADISDPDTSTVPTPDLAAAIAAAVGGAPIPEAFLLQGITIPAPGSEVTAPLDPARLTPGDIGIFADRHALALSSGKALLDGQIQPTANVSGPGFLGWQHPPQPDQTNRPNTMSDIPALNRAAATAPS